MLRGARRLLAEARPAVPGAALGVKTVRLVEGVPVEVVSSEARGLEAIAMPADGDIAALKGYLSDGRLDWEFGSWGKGMLWLWDCSNALALTDTKAGYQGPTMRVHVAMMATLTSQREFKV